MFDRVYAKSLVGEAATRLTAGVGATLPRPKGARSPRAEPPTPGFAGTGRHKGVPYDSPGVAWRQWPLTKDWSHTHMASSTAPAGQVV